MAGTVLSGAAGAGREGRVTTAGDCNAEASGDPLSANGGKAWRGPDRTWPGLGAVGIGLGAAGAGCPGTSAGPGETCAGDLAVGAGGACGGAGGCGAIGAPTGGLIGRPMPMGGRIGACLMRIAGSSGPLTVVGSGMAPPGEGPIGAGWTSHGASIRCAGGRGRTWAGGSGSSVGWGVTGTSNPYRRRSLIATSSSIELE